MSRIGKYPVTIPAGVTVSINDNVVTVKGKLGELSCSFDDGHIAAKLEDNKVVVTPLSQSMTARALWGTTRANIHDLVKGVDEGFCAPGDGDAQGVDRENAHCVANVVSPQAVTRGYEQGIYAPLFHFPGGEGGWCGVVDMVEGDKFVVHTSIE